MEKNRLELRNKKFMSSGFDGNIGNPVKWRKIKRAEGFLAHRYIERILSIESSSDDAKQILEHFEPVGINDNKLLPLVEKLQFLLKFNDLTQSVLTLLGNLTLCSDSVSILIVQSGLFIEILNLLHSDQNSFTESVLICIGNILLSLKTSQSWINPLQIPFHIHNYLIGDYEKPDTTLKASLWCYWCLVHTENIDFQGLSLILSIIPELFEYNELHKELFQILLTLTSNKYSPLPGLEKVAFMLCELELSNCTSQIYFILILNHLSQFNELRKRSKDCVKKFIGWNDEVNVAAFEYISKIDLEILLDDWDLVLVCIEWCGSGEVKVSKSSSFLLRKIVGGMSQGDVCFRFNVEVLSLFKDVLNRCEAEIEKCFIDICRILLRAGLKEQFIEAGCLEKLSVMYYESKSEATETILELVKEYFEQND